MGFTELIHRVEHGMFVREREPAEPGAPTVVWVHGLGESGLGFERIVGHPELAPWRHLVPDLPGYGRSPWVDPPPSLPQLAGRLADWLADSGEKSVVLCGHSMGGVIGQLLVERRAEGVRGLIDVDGNVSAGDCVFSQRVVGHSLEAFVARRYDKLCEALYQEGVEELPLRGYYVSLRLANPRAFYRNARELVELSTPETLADHLASLPVPKLYVAGHPGGADARSLELLEAAGVPLSLVEPAGHWPFLDRPDEFAAVVAGFLRRLGSPEAAGWSGMA
jgi:pimeloyl-ACP methyl ester carboxylesterase